MSLNPLENCGPQFNLEDYLRAQEKTKQVALNFAKNIKPGMTEKEAKALLEATLDNSGLEKRWHPTKMRMGVNTTCSFRDESVDYTLKDDDLFFIDIGPVYYDHEGDYGETFTVGNNQRHKHLALATKTVFYNTQKAWSEMKLTGSELYAFAEEEAKKLNLKLNTKMYGHRLGDFPHAVFSRERLGDLNFTPAPKLWVLEIHLIDEELGLGAFFEDVLL